MPRLVRRADYFVGQFAAMASDCEVLIDTDNQALAQSICICAVSEVTRLEHKYSRYRDDNILYRINQGGRMEVDEETARLLDYAQQLHTLSDGLFDVTSGVLRRAWHFDGSDRLPSAEQVEALLPLIGWHKVYWHKPEIHLAAGMEIDFGGIGKEYAADRAVLAVNALLAEQTNHYDQQTPVLVNLGGDLAINGPRRNGAGWQVAFDNGDKQTEGFSLQQGGVATSGDSHRYLQKDGVRYSHVLDPRSGWPVKHAPATVTVVANSCTDAGMLSTLALLHGAEAEAFLRGQGVPYWVRTEC
ncbi:MAG TPA: FAD:protein FMN transferase [Gammaproteobacteria bacterium]|nr:FAD:protein FMN transferase [Gammaproteobacteria bacterium]